MEFQSIFSGEIKKTLINLSSAEFEFAHRMTKVESLIQIYDG